MSEQSEFLGPDESEHSDRKLQSDIAFLAIAIRVTQLQSVSARCLPEAENRPLSDFDELLENLSAQLEEKIDEWLAAMGVKADGAFKL